MQSDSSRIWTRVAVSISYNDNHYTTGSNILQSNNRSAIYLPSRKPPQKDEHIILDIAGEARMNS